MFNKKNIATTVAIATLFGSSISFADTEATKVDVGRNATAFSQGSNIINGMAEPESPDGMKLPVVNFAKEQKLKIQSSNGKPQGGGGVIQAKIEGDLYVKYGDPVLGGHAYGCNNQAQYDKLVSTVQGWVKEVQFRKQGDWVYLQHYFKGGKGDSFVDVVLQQNGIYYNYGQWKNKNKYVIQGLQKGLITKSEAENLMTYQSVLSYISSKVGRTTNPDETGAKCYSAYQKVFEKISDCDSDAHLDILVGDILGFNMMIAGEPSHVEGFMLSGNYWWRGGHTPTIKKTDNPFGNYNMIMAAPTINISEYYKTYN